MKAVKKRPTIAIDVDGVLRDNLGIIVDIYNNAFNVGLKESDVKHFKTEVSFPLVQERLGIKASDYFFNLKAKEVFFDAPAYPYVCDDIERLKEVADVIIVTYQKDYTNKRYTLDWLEKNGIEPNGICFLKDKTHLTKCDYFVDDNDYNFHGFKCKVGCLINAPYNEDINMEDILNDSEIDTMYRFGNFHEFTEFAIKNLT